MTRGPATRATLLAAALALLAACASTPEPDPRHRPTTSVLEVVAVLQRHVPDDTYRFEPARDFTGRNVYRASLLRLENLEKLHAESLRAGTLDDVIAFAKGRALERLRAYDLAARFYRQAAEREGALQLEALGSAALNDSLAEARALLEAAVEAPPPPAAAAGPAGADEGAPAGPELREAGPVVDPAARLARFEAPQALLRALEPDVEGTHYAAIVQEELERVDAARARFLVDGRRLFPDGDVRALAALQQLVSRHRESKNANDHLLELADLYAVLAEEYVQAHPPESLDFDPPRFEELVESAARLYEAVANQDGAPEKLEAGRRLEAFLAFTLEVDRDRFSP
jgi:hypothetical protein